MKNKVVPRIGFLFICVYAAYALCLYFYEGYEYWQELKDKKTVQLLGEAKLAHTLLEAGREDVLLERLRDSLEQKRIHGFSLKKNNEQLSLDGLNSAELEKFSEAPQNAYSKLPGAEFARVNLGAYDLILFQKQSKVFHFQRLVKENKGKILADIAFVLFFVLSLMLYHFRDYFKVLAVLQGKERAALSRIKGVSSDGEVLLSALKTYETKLADTKETNLLYRNQILPALQKELDSGKVAPYSFSCTMVRTDINQFSNIFNKYPREAFMQVVNDFFLECTHCISRYGGVVHEFAGDEVIYYFKEEEYPSEFLAISCVRDIGLIAERFHAKTEYPFRVKSSLASGELRFGKLVHSYSLAGGPFIESVRLLSLVNEKEKNSCIYGEKVAKKLQALIEQKDLGFATLKGYEEEFKIYSYLEHKSMDPLLLQLATADIPKEIYAFRSDADIRNIFSFLRKNTAYLGLEKVRSILNVLKSYTFSRMENETEAVFLFWLKEDKLVQEALWDFLPKFFFGKQWNSDLEEAFEQTTKQGGKALAYALEALSEFKPNDIRLHRFLKHETPRVFAAAWVALAKQEISDSLVQHIQNKLKDTKYAPSCIFALGKVMQYWQEKDPIYLSTKISFHTLLQNLPKSAEVKDAKVKKQLEILQKNYKESA